MFQWPGCEVTIRGTDPTYCKPYPVYTGYPKIPDLQQNIEEGLEVFRNGSADVVGKVCLFDQHDNFS